MICNNLFSIITLCVGLFIGLLFLLKGLHAKANNQSDPVIFDATLSLTFVASFFITFLGLTQKIHLIGFILTLPLAVYLVMQHPDVHQDKPELVRASLIGCAAGFLGGFSGSLLAFFISLL